MAVNYEKRNRGIAQAATKGVRTVKLALDYDLSVSRVRSIIRVYKKKVKEQK